MNVLVLRTHGKQGVNFYAGQRLELESIPEWADKDAFQILDAENEEKVDGRRKRRNAEE